MTTVNVYIISTGKPDQPGGISPQAKRLFELFSSPIFQTTILKLDTPAKNIKVDYPGFDTQAKNELYRFILALKDGTKTGNNEPILFISDTSVTDADATTIEGIVTSVLANQWDICYLSKWLDSCDLFTDKKIISKNGTVLVNAVNPHGLQALLIRPGQFKVDAATGELLLASGDKVAFEKNVSTTFQNLIANKKLKAATVTPNLFEVDPLTITKPEDYVKLNECRDVSAISNNPNISNQGSAITSNPNFITWILLGVALLLILFLLFRK
jgi:hypothetical protein